MARRDAGQGDSGALDPALMQKKRARRRLIGALVLGIVAAVGLPLVLDPEPRQTITDVEIEIPPRDAPLPSATSGAAAGEERALAPSVAAGAAAASAASDKLASDKLASDKVVAEKSTADKSPAEKPVVEKPTVEKPTVEKPTVEKAPAAKAASESAGTAAKAAPEKLQATKTQPPAARPDGRFLLQAGAFASAGSARAQADKARKAGVRVYTETVKTAQGERTRVRIGPFATREAADQARAKLKLIGVDAVPVAP